MHFFYSSCGAKPTLTPPTVPITSRAFLYGDHVYEVLRTYDGCPFQAEEHYNRMLSSLTYLRYNVFPSFDTFCQDLSVILSFSRRTLQMDNDLYVRVHFGRSPDTQIGLWPDPSLTPIWAYMVAPIDIYLKHYPNGIRLGVSPLFRHLPESFSPNVKTGNYLNNMIGCIDAKSRGFDDAVFVHPIERFLCEGSTFNLAFLDDNGVLVFPDPAPSAPYLVGVTQRVFTESPIPNPPPYRFEKVTLETASKFRYALTLSTLRELQWVSGIEDKTFSRPPDSWLAPYRNHFKRVVSYNCVSLVKRFQRTPV